MRIGTHVSQAGRSVIVRGAVLMLLLSSALFATAQEVPAKYNASAVTKVPDVPFANVDGHELSLDLYLPKNLDKPPLVVWVHGGAWKIGSKERVNAIGLSELGFAIASVSYRLSPVAPYPAQIFDIKSGIRYLRKHADEYGYDPDRFAIAGASAGAHLATLVGLTNGSDSHEGNVGKNLDVSSDVQAIISYFGASDLLTILDQSTPRGLEVRVPALELLLGGSLSEMHELAKHASPVFQLDTNDPPLFLLHGDQDPQMPVNQTLELWGAAKDLGLNVQLEVVHGAEHGGPQFFDTAHLKMAADFLDQNLVPN